MNRKQRRMQAAQQRTSGSLGAPPAEGSAMAQHLATAQALREAGQLPESRERLERALGIEPDDPRVLCELAHVQRMMERPSEAARSLRQALRAAPRSPEILANLAATLRDLGEAEEALRAYSKVVEWKPDFVQAHCELGSTLQDLGRPGEAVAAYRRSLAVDSRQPAVLANLGFACLEVGDPAGALEAIDACLAMDPHCGVAVVAKAYALGELGRRDEADEWMGLERCVRALALSEVAEVDDLEAFQEELQRHLEHHPSLALEPNQRTTRLGRQTGELMRGDKGPCARLEAALERAVARYLDDLPREAGHPWLSHRPRSLRLSMWGTLLGRGGHQAPHFHPAAWVSGVYYVRVPAEVRDDDPGQQGWIEFGQPPESFRLQGAVPVRRLRPRAGEVVLFPSYMYHRTIPFESDSPRISIAMDAVPER